MGAVALSMGGGGASWGWHFPLGGSISLVGGLTLVLTWLMVGRGAA